MCSHCWWGRVSCSCRASKTPAARSSENGEVMWWAWPVVASRPSHFWNPLPVCWVLGAWKVLWREWGAGKITLQKWRFLKSFWSSTQFFGMHLWGVGFMEPCLHSPLAWRVCPLLVLCSLTSHLQIWSALPNCSTAVSVFVWILPLLEFLSLPFSFCSEIPLPNFTS